MAQVVRNAQIRFDANGNPASISIDGSKPYSGFANAGYVGSKAELANAILSVQAIFDSAVNPTKDTATLPNYTIIHHRDGKPIAISSHS